MVNLVRRRRIWTVAAVLASLPPLLAAQEVAETRRVVREVSFEGNDALDDLQLRISIATTQSSWFQRAPLLRLLPFGEKRYFNEREFRRDVLRLKVLYAQSGFLEADVDTLVRRDSGNVWVRFLITEGLPVRVRSLAIEGAEPILAAARLRSAIPLRVGAPFNRRLLYASADTIRTALRDRGHPFAEVFLSFDEDRVERAADVTLTVDPGPPAVVGRIEVVGARKIPPDVVQRLLAVEPGKPYAERDLYESQVELYRSGVYNHVSVALVDSQPPPDSQVTVRVRLSEGPLHRLRFGAGYGTIDCLRGVGTWSAYNVFGGARQLLVNGRVARVGVAQDQGLQTSLCPGLRNEDPELLTLNYNVSGTLREPVLFSRRTSLALTLFAERRSEFQAYLRTAAGGDVTLTRRLSRWKSLSLAQSVVWGSTLADPATLCAFLNVCASRDTIFSRRRVTSKLTAGLAADYRNAALDPTAGHTWSVELAYASPAIGSDSLSQFLRGQAEYASYHELSPREVLAWRVRVGTMVTPDLNFAAGTEAFLPPEERFYAGGPSTVRGFGQNELGPVVRVLERVDSTTGPGGLEVDSLIRTSPIGGRGLLLANLEYRFSLAGSNNRVMGALFVDAGQVFERARDVYRVWEMRVTPGIGVRIASPLGPVRLDLALNLFRPQTSVLYAESVPGQLTVADPEYTPRRSTLGKLRFHVSVGQAF